MAYTEDSRVPSFLVSLQELIQDNETNEMIEMCIQRFFGSHYTHLIQDRNFVFNLFSKFIYESLIKEEASDKFSINETRLGHRSKVLTKFVYNYREYQLNLLLVLCEIKINLGLSDEVFDKIIKTLHTNGVITEDGFNHWFGCKSGFEQRLKVIYSCSYLLQMTQEAREDFFYESN